MTHKTEKEYKALPEEEKGRCTLTNDELSDMADKWVRRLIDSAGRDWCLPVPANPNKDVDLILCELIVRFRKTANLTAEIERLKEEREWISVEDRLPKDMQLRRVAS